jgi:hypothetical protein
LLPPFAGLAVNVTEVPAHTGLSGFAAIDTNGATVGFTVNVPELTILAPEEGVTVISPVVAAAGKRAVICVLLFTVYVAIALLKVTAVAPLKPVPVMTTEVVEPVQELIGEKLDIDWAKLLMLAKKASKISKNK